MILFTIAQSAGNCNGRKRPSAGLRRAGRVTTPAARRGIAFSLPQPQISIHISTGWHEGTPIVENYYDKNGNLYEWENTILPDVFIYQDIEDVRQGKDSVIEWILAQ